MISKGICENVLRAAMATGADYAELYANNTLNHTITMIDSKVDTVKDTVIAGAGIRV